MKTKTIKKIIVLKLNEWLDTITDISLRDRVRENIVVSGVVVYKGPDIHGLPSLELSDKANGTSYVLCVFDSFDSINKISKGDNLTVSGKFHIISSNEMVVLKQSQTL